MRCLCIFSILGVLVVTSACGDKEPQAKPAAPTVTTAPALTAPAAATPVAPAAAPVPREASVAGVPTVVPAATHGSDQATADEKLEALNGALGEFMKENKRMPSGLEELRQNGYIRGTPKAPPGKKFHLDTNKKAIVLTAA